MASFTEDVINSVWEKATPVANNDPNIWRKDFAGAWIRRDHYGKETTYGWEIDHLKPLDQGGTDDLGNLYPLHWRNNRKKSNNYPTFSTIVTSSRTSNIDFLKTWRVE